MAKKWWKEPKAPPKVREPEQRTFNSKGEEMVVVPGMGVMPKSSIMTADKKDHTCTAVVPAGKRDYKLHKPLSGYGPQGDLVGKGGYDYKTQSYTTTYTYVPHPKHKGDPIKVGKFEVLAGAMRDLTEDDIGKADILVPLTQDIPNFKWGHVYRVVALPLVDYGGVPEIWGEYLKEVIIPLIEDGKKLLAYCVGSHGRTGTFLASLIALMESKEETPDPIAAARARHCKKCVESLAQAKAVFALRGEVLPKKYEEEFGKKYTAGTTYAGAGGYGGYAAGQTFGAGAACGGKKSKKDKGKVGQSSSALVDEGDEWYDHQLGGKSWDGY